MVLSNSILDIGGDMEMLFKNKTTYDLELYQKFQNFHNSKYQFGYRFYTLFFVVLILFCSIGNFVTNNVPLGALFLIVLLVFISWRFFYPYFFIRKEASSKKITNHMTNIYTFFDKYIKIKNTQGPFQFSYRKLTKVFETKDTFYLYINKTHSFIVQKSGFLVGTPDDFSGFIKQKVGFKYTKEK